VAKAKKNIIFTLESASPAEDSTVKRAEKREDTRSRIAVFYIAGYLAVILVLLAAVTFFKLSSDISKDFLLAIGSPLGFIIGFYFKSTDKEWLLIIFSGLKPGVVHGWNKEQHNRTGQQNTRDNGPTEASP